MDENVSFADICFVPDVHGFGFAVSGGQHHPHGKPLALRGSNYRWRAHKKLKAEGIGLQPVPSATDLWTLEASSGDFGRVVQDEADVGVIHLRAAAH